VDTERLRRELRKQLPAYMVPGQLVKVDTIPLSRNGKIDRKALSGLAVGAGRMAGSSYTAARNALEEQLVRMWEQVLGRTKIGIHEDFFLLGGHSLKAARLLNQYYQQLGVRLSLQQLFAQPTIAEQAIRIERMSKEEYAPILPIATASDYAVSEGQRRIWLASQGPEGSAAYNIPVSFEIRGDLHVNHFRQAFRQVVNRHEILRTVFFENQEGELRQRIQEPPADGFEFEYEDYRQQQEKEQKAMADVRAVSEHSFSLQKGPLIRAGLLHLQDNLYLFFCNMHHIISDGWSMAILCKEVLGYYRGSGRGVVPQPPAMRVQFKDYAAWQLMRSQIGGGSMLDFWVSELTGEIPRLNITGAVRPDHKSFKAGQVFLELAADEVGELESLAARHSGTLFMATMAIVNTLLHFYSGQEEILTGITVAGREHPDLEDQIGYYVRTLPIRCRIGADDPFSSFLLQSVNKIRAALMNQDFSFELLMDQLRKTRDHIPPTLFDVLVNFQDRRGEISGAVIDLPGIQTIDLPIPLDSGKRDLTFYINVFPSSTRISLVYDADLFRPEFMEGFLERFRSVLAAVLENPNNTLREIRWRSMKEKERSDRAQFIHAAMQDISEDF